MGYFPPTMADHTPIHGELQTQLMLALWRLGQGTVEEVRSALPGRYRGAYNTVQTVLNRLADRGLLSRQRTGNAFVYRPTITEAEYVTESIRLALGGASADARQAALASLVGDLEEAELAELRRMAEQSGGRRPRL